MDRDVAFLKADICDELSKLERLEVEFAEAQRRVDFSAHAVPNYDRGAVGFLLHNFYNGCENVFLSIARFFENDLDAGSWHRDLLKRMTLAIPGVRPRVIDEELFRLLDDFRAFHHRFRHAYGFELDWEREKLVASRLPPAGELFRNQVEGFLRALEDG